MRLVVIMVAVASALAGMLAVEEKESPAQMQPDSDVALFV